MSTPSLLDYAKALPLYVLPHLLLSRIVYHLTRSRHAVLKSGLIRLFNRFYRIDMTAAEEPDFAAYPSFNAFFTRKLRADARPVAARPDAFVSPVDGCVSQVGTIQSGLLLQAKGHHFKLLQLLGNDAELAAHVADGCFVTLYLSPRDYHRIHMPILGHLRKQIYVPGRLFAVNGPSTRVIPGVFARNERVVTAFDTEAGPMVLVLVGALFVGSMETVWAGEVTPNPGHTLQTTHFGPQGVDSITLLRGAELGRFNMGSTVILLFGKNKVQWAQHLSPGTPVQMGEQLGTLLLNSETTLKR